jgi:thymidine phosphorylase
LDADFLGQAAALLGAGRERSEDVIDPGVGFELLVNRGDRVETGQPLAQVYYRDEARLAPLLALLRQACRIDEQPPPRQELILEEIG